MISKICKIAGLTLAVILAYVLISGVIYPYLCIRLTKFSNEQSRYIQQIEDTSASVLCIDDNLDALIWRLKVIESAEDEIILTTFDFSDDNSGKDIMAALTAAADRGVKVRLIVDGINAQLKLNRSENFRAFTMNKNVTVKYYNPVQFLKLWNVNYRMHDKYLIADDSVYILGGRNTNDLFLGNYKERYNIDRDMLVYEGENDGKNSTLAQLKGYFNELWSQSYCKEFRYEKAESHVLEQVNFLQSRYEDLKVQYAEAFMDTDFSAATEKVDSISLISNSMIDKSKSPYVWNAICEEMSAGVDILIQTPYIICDKVMYKGISALADAGKNISIITNAVASGANPWGCTDYLNQKKNILEAGVTVYECLAGQSLHTKTILIDEDISIVGSFNMDARSTYLDTEMMLVIKSKEQNQQLRADAMKYKERSLEVLPDGTETEQSAYEEKSLPWNKKLFYGVLRILVRPIRHLL